MCPVRYSFCWLFWPCQWRQRRTWHRELLRELSRPLRDGLAARKQRLFQLPASAFAGQCCPDQRPPKWSAGRRLHREDRVRFLWGSICELQSGQDAKGDFLSVIERMRFGQRRQAIVNGMGCRQSPAFKTDSTQQDISLDDVLQSRRDDAHLTGDLGRNTIGQQRFIAEFGDAESCRGGISAALVRRVGSLAGSGFKPRRQSVAHPSHKKSCGGRSDDVHVYQHCCRVQFLIVYALENPAFCMVHRWKQWLG